MLSPSTGYAAIALGYLAECEAASARVEQIAQARDIPLPYLGKIMHALSRKGLVQTRRGVGGGVTLRIDPNTLTLLDVCKALDDPIMAQRCMLGVSECSDERACPAHEFWTKHRRKLIEFAEKTSIQAIGQFERLRREKQSPKKGAAPAKRALQPSRPRKKRGKS